MSNDWLKYLNKSPVDWLLKSDPWTRYRTLVDLLGESVTNSSVKEARSDIGANPYVNSLIEDAYNWFTSKAKRHDDSTLSHYKLRVLTDFGLDITNSKVYEIVEKVKEHTDSELFAIRQELPKKQSSGEWNALPCDSPIISSTLYRLGDRSKELLRSIDLLKSKWSSDSGWFCHLFFVESQYKKLGVGCPMAGLQMLELLSILPDKSEDIYINRVFEPIKYHKDCGRSLYYFGRSKKFWSFKYPFVWYNSLYMGDVITRFNVLKNSEVTKEIISWILESQDDRGQFRPTSMFRAYKGWEFSNKKQESSWITYLCCRILKQYYN